MCRSRRRSPLELTPPEAVMAQPTAFCRASSRPRAGPERVPSVSISVKIIYFTPDRKSTRLNSSHVSTSSAGHAPSPPSPYTTLLRSVPRLAHDGGVEPHVPEPPQIPVGAHAPGGGDGAAYCLLQSLQPPQSRSGEGSVCVNICKDNILYS